MRGEAVVSPTWTESGLHVAIAQLIHVIRVGTGADTGEVRARSHMWRFTFPQWITRGAG
jgi:hypothetical protein